MKHRSRRRVLVAGAAGFIGSHLCERLLQDGFEVVGIDNLLTGRLRNLRHLEREPLFDFLQHDIVEPIPDLGPFDWVFHLASPASPPAYQEHALECLRTNSEGTLQLLRLALDQRARFFLTSTSEVYGDPLQHPQRESYWGERQSGGAAEHVRRGQAVRRDADHDLSEVSRIVHTHRANLQYVRTAHGSG